MDLRQPRQRGRVFVADIRLLADDTETGTRHVAEHHIKGVLPLRTEFTTIRRLRRNTVDAQPLRAVSDAFELVLMQITGYDLAFVPHGERRGKRLAARRRTDVEHAHPRFNAGDERHQPRRGVLHDEFAAIERAQRRQIAYAGQFEAIRHPRVRLGVNARAGQFTYQRVCRRFQRVDLRRYRRDGIVAAQERFSLPSAQQRGHALRQPPRVARLYRNSLNLVLRQRRKRVLVLRQLPQHRVDQSCRRAALRRLGELYRLVDRRAVRHLVQKQDLIRADAQDIRQRLL